MTKTELDTDEYKTIIEILTSVKETLLENDVHPLHLIINIPHLDAYEKTATELKEYIEEHEEVYPGVHDVIGIPCSYLHFALPAVFGLVLTNDPFMSPIVTHSDADELINEALSGKNSSEYIM